MIVTYKSELSGSYVLLIKCLQKDDTKCLKQVQKVLERWRLLTRK